MPRIVRCSIIQASNAVPATEALPAQKKAMVEKHLGLIRQAAKTSATQEVSFPKPTPAKKTGVNERTQVPRQA